MSVEELHAREIELAAKEKALSMKRAEARLAFNQVDDEWSQAWGEWAHVARLYREAREKEAS